MAGGPGPRAGDSVPRRRRSQPEVRQAAVRETYEKARYNNLQNLRKKRKDSHGVLDKHTIQEALGKLECQPRQPADVGGVWDGRLGSAA